jgi:5'-nucleotidase
VDDVDRVEPWILLTNDDGADSPALMPFMRSLAELAPVRAVVPASERSWASKKMSRFGRLRLERRDASAGELWLLDGYPADCTNLGIHSLFPTPPALVVSGINVGANAGLAYFLSSGTVGAAVEGTLGGLPAAAFSLQLAPEDYRRWRQSRSMEGMEGMWEAAAEVGREVVAEIWRGGLPAGAALLNVNMPPGVGVETPRRFAGLASSTYGAFFAPEEEAGHYSYSLQGLRLLESDGCSDIEALERGEVAITPVRFAFEAEAPAQDRRRFERN